MKNLTKLRRKNFVCLALAVVSFILSVVMPTILPILFPDAYNANPQLITVLTLLLFMLIAVVLFVKNIKRTILTEALASNERTIRGDRVSFPSADGTFNEEKIKTAFAEDGFTVVQTDNGFTAQKDTKTLVCRFLVTSDVNAAHCSVENPDKKKNTAAVTVFLCNSVAEEQKQTAKMIDGCMQYAEMTVYADLTTGLAYYNGGTYTKDSPEAAAQSVILHNVLLRDTLPEKTEADKTAEEKELEKADIETLLYEITHPGQEEMREAQSLQDGELRMDLSRRNGVILFRTGDAVISHPFEVDEEGFLHIPDINDCVIIFPKMRGARKHEISAFKQALEKRLSDEGISFKYE